MILFIVAVTLLLCRTAAAQPGGTTELVPELQILREESESISRGLGEERPISEAPSNVYVITDEDIRHSGAVDIPTILRRIPGMEVMQMSQADFAVSMRGDNQTAANKLLVLVDGRPIYEYAFGSVFWTLLPVTMPEIKRIEVWKGPASAIYGFNAFDGVVNIITKSPEEMKANTKGSFVQFGGGEYGTIRSAAVQSGTEGKFGYRLSFGHDQSQKWSDRNALAFRANKVNLNTEYALTRDSKFVFSGGVVDSNRWDGQVFDVVRESSKITNGYVNAAYERPNFFVRMNWTRWNRDHLELLNPSILNSVAAITDRNGNVNETFQNDVYMVWAQHAVDLGEANRLTYGVNGFHNAVTHVNIFDSDTQEDRLGFYVQDEIRLTRSLTLIAGVRWDLHTELNPTYSPRLALLYKPTPNHTFRISGSVAYRPPNPLETHLDQRNVLLGDGGFSVVGSRSLVPEKIVSYELGYQGWYFRHKVRLRGDLFYNHISNFIAGAATADPAIFTFANFGSADLYGGEAGAEFLVTSWLTGFINYATVQLHQTSDLVAAQGIVTRGAPPVKVNAGLRGEWENGLSAEALFHYVSAASYPISSGYSTFESLCACFTPPQNSVPAYALLNLRAAYRFWKDKAEVAVSAFNALNDHHRENPVGEVIASRVMGWLTLRY